MNRYKVTLENYDGRCKRVFVTATDQWSAMAASQTGGWFPVDVTLVK